MHLCKNKIKNHTKKTIFHKALTHHNASDNISVWHPEMLMTGFKLSAG